MIILSSHRFAKTARILAMLTGVLFLAGCTNIPDGIEPIDDFNITKYLGQWYEIARLDHSFERGLSEVTAFYELRNDGGVKVINQGYSVENQSWDVAEGKAYFVSDANKGHLKVSFFGPFYGSYVIFELDKNYQYAFVTGPNKKYLWLLSRSPNLDPQIENKFVKTARKNGYNIDDLIFVEHSTNPENVR